MKRAQLSAIDATWKYFDVNEICESKAKLIGSLRLEAMSRRGQDHGRERTKRQRERQRERDRESEKKLVFEVQPKLAGVSLY